MHTKRSSLQESRCFDALADLYSLLGEEDMLAGLWKRRAACEETRVALAAAAHGLAESAQSALLNVLRRGANGMVTAPGPGGVPQPGSRLAGLTAPFKTLLRCGDHRICLSVQGHRIEIVPASMHMCDMKSS